MKKETKQRKMDIEATLRATIKSVNIINAVLNTTVASVIKLDTLSIKHSVGVFCLIKLLDKKKIIDADELWKEIEEEKKKQEKGKAK